MKQIPVTQYELWRLRKLEDECARLWLVFDEAAWVEGVRGILGDRTPPLFSQTELVVVRELPWPYFQQVAEHPIDWEPRAVTTERPGMDQRAD